SEPKERGSTHSWASASPYQERTCGVSIVVGSSALTVTPLSRSSAAAVCTSVHSPVTEALNALQVTTGCMTVLEPITNTLPRPCACMAGMTARNMLTAVRRFPVKHRVPYVVVGVFYLGAFLKHSDKVRQTVDLAPLLDGLAYRCLRARTRSPVGFGHEKRCGS